MKHFNSPREWVDAQEAAQPRIEEQIWYTIQVSRTGAEDWFAHGTETYDKLSTARRAVRASNAEGFEYRVVRVTQTEEVV